MKIKKVLAKLDKEDLVQIKETGTFIIPDEITDIGDLAFISARNLKTIIIPESVEYIGQLAFAGCSKLEEITFKGKPKIDAKAFEDCYAKLIVFDEKLTKQDRSDIVSDFVDADGDFYVAYPESSLFVEMLRTGIYKSPNNIDTILDSTLRGVGDVRKVIISENVKKIEQFAFCNCPNLKEVKFEGAPEINVFAFDNCGIERIIIGKNIKGADRDRLVAQLGDLYDDRMKFTIIFEDSDGNADEIENDDENANS